MTTFKEQAQDFLAQKSIAVVGVSHERSLPANLVYKTLRAKGYQVYAVNPKATTVEGDPCYPNVKGLPARPDGVVIMTRAALNEQVVRECAEAGVPRVWMHENAMAGAANSSVSPEAVKLGTDSGLTIIPGGCPMMFLEFGHKCMRWVLGLMGKLPA